MTSKELRTLVASTMGPGDAPRWPRRRADARKVLEGCWAPMWRILGARMITVVREAVGTAAKDINEDLNKPARRLLVQSEAIVERYEKALREEFTRALDDFAEQRVDDKPVAKSRATLSLVEYGAMELSTLVEASASRALNSVDEHYTNLKLRVASLVREIEIREAESPFRPVLFFRALHRAIKQLDTLSEQELVEFLPRFDGPMTQPLVKVYEELDRHLEGRGYVAEVAPLSVWRNTVRGRATQGGVAVTRAHTAAAGGNGGGGGGMSVAGAEQLLAALYQRLNLASMPVGAMSLPGAPVGGVAASVGAQPQAGAASGALPVGGVPVSEACAEVPLPPVAAGLLFGGQLPAGVAEAGARSAPHVVQVDLLSAIAEIQKLGALAMTAVQQGQPAPDASIDNAQLRGKLVDKANEQVDKLTIEIVGLLFERINQDRHVPQPIKEALQRLQFPMITVALTDPELFVAPDQPARTLIDRIASTSIGWTSEGQENQRYLAEVQRAVHAVLSSAETGSTPFESALEGFERYLAEEHTRDDDPVTRAKKALAEAENREIMAISTMIQVRGLFEGLQIESYLREFLLETWVRVMVASQLRNPEDAKAMHKFMVIVPDLVWSVQPKLSPEERKRLVNTIPPVLTVLREGLALIDWPKESMKEFFGRLMNSHAEAVKALELAHRTPGKPVAPAADTMIRSRLVAIKLDGLTDPPPRSDIPAHLNERIVKQVLAANQADVNLLPKPATTGEEIDLLDEEELNKMISGFKRGDWFNLRLGDVTERVRLRWVSPQQTLYLFTPADGRHAHSLAPDTLREYLRRRELQPAVAEPLFDRAVRGMVYELELSASGA